MSLPDDLSQKTLNDLIARVDAKEVLGADGGPFLPLTSASEKLDAHGKMRVFTSDKVAKIIYCGLVVPALNMDTHMIFGFTAPDSPVPHFTLDSVHANGTLAFHLDLIPRAELATHVPYMDYVYGGLTETYETTSEWDSLTKAHITPRQYAMMSPWMLVNRANEEGFKAIGGPVKTYLDHWLGLVETPVPAEVVDSVKDTDLADRDAKQRANLFNPEVDPVWNQIIGLVGDEAVLKMRAQLESNAI